MPEVNPYAPSRHEEAGPVGPRRAAKVANRSDIVAALAALDEHLADPQKVAIDRKAWGGRVRKVTFALLAGAAVSLATGLALPKDAIASPAIALYVLAACLTLIGLIALGMDLSLAPREGHTTPVATLRSYLRSMPTGRFDYAWTCLAPTARAQRIDAPHLGPVAAGIGTFSMATPQGLKDYAGTFSRAGGGQMRAFQVKEVALESEEPDVAVVRARLTFQSWPQWANIVLGVGAATAVRLGDIASPSMTTPLRLLGLAGAIGALIGLYVLRKSQVVLVRRTLLRGRNGTFYLYDPDILEGATHPPQKP